MIIFIVGITMYYILFIFVYIYIYIYNIHT